MEPPRQRGACANTHKILTVKANSRTAAAGQGHAFSGEQLIVILRRPSDLIVTALATGTVPYATASLQSPGRLPTTSATIYGLVEAA